MVKLREYGKEYTKVFCAILETFLQVWDYVKCKKIKYNIFS